MSVPASTSISNPRIRQRSSEEIGEKKRSKHSSYKSTTETDSTSSINENMTTITTENLTEAVATAVRKEHERMESPEYLEKLAKIFATHCHVLIDASLKKTEEKIAAVDNKTIELDNRVKMLEKMADESEQNRREYNLIIRGAAKSETPKITVSEQLTRSTAILVTPEDIKYVIKIDNKDGNLPTDSFKISFYQKKKRDDVYGRRASLKGSTVYLSEDLTPKRCQLAYEARQYARAHPGSTTWTFDGKIFIKDSLNDKPRLITNITELNKV